MATQQLPESGGAGGLVGQADALLRLLGGTTQTSNPGETDALRATLGQLQGTDYSAMLQAIFNKAGGQIPGLQQALGNAIGARSGGNSAVQAALQRLLAETSTNAMDQVAKLQSQNMATQANVGQSIASATKGTTQTAGTDVNSGLTQAAKLLAVLQGAKTLGLTDYVKELTSPVAAAQAPAQAPAATQSVMSASAAPLSSAGDVPMFNLTGSFPTAGSGESYLAPQVGSPDFQYTDMTGFQTPSAPITYTPSFEPAPVFELPVEEFQTYTFADGGLVKKPEGYADGGTVRAGGSRRSANPTVDLVDPQLMLAQGAAQQLQGQFSPATQTLQKPQQAQALSSPSATASGSDMANALASSGDLSAQMSPQAYGTAVNKVGAVSNISGALGGPTLGPAGSILGLSAGLANAQGPEQALGTVGKFAAGMAAPGAAGLVSFAQNPTLSTGVNVLAGFNPIGALWNAAATLGDFATVGEVAQNATELASPNQMMSPDQQAIAAEFKAALSGGGGNGRDTNYGDRGPGGSSGEAGAAAAGANAAGPGLANGGAVDGPGTGTSDSITAQLSDGEFVISADVVQALGEDFFNQLQAAFHTPAAQQRRA